MKTTLTYLFLMAIVALLFTMMVDAWDREDAIRAEKTQQYIKWLNSQKGVK